MKQSEYNEIDSLLRHLAGSKGSVRAGSAKSIGDELSPHLDADELSSYVEGALPTATRVRYTSHLADCDDCRQMVVQLSLASGVVIKEDSGTQDSAVRSTWKQILAAFFAPAVLRFALPAMALVVVAFAFFAWRQQRETTRFVALNQHADAPSSVQTKEDGGAKQSAGLADKQSGREAQKVERPQPNSTPIMADEETAKENRGNDKKSADAPASGSSAGTVTKESKEKDLPKDQDAMAKPAYATEPAPPPAPKLAVSTLAKAPAKVKEETAEARDESANQREADRSKGNGASTEQAPAAKRADTSRRAGVASTTGGRAGDDEGEMRTVSGRRFQRRNGAWVDNAYNSSASTTSVARGSEQYRALVADEPGIAAIANQLSGEVFLVWKSRAYHIH